MTYTPPIHTALATLWGIDAPWFPHTALQLLAFALVLMISLVDLLCVTYVVFYLVTLPLRREERARFFLDLLESGFRQGKTAEQTVVQVAQSRDRCLGRRLPEVADYIEQGTPLSLALRWVPGVVPPPLVEMLAAGEEVGDLAAIVPACRNTLTLSRAQGRPTWQYFNMVVYAMWPAAVLVLLAAGFGVFILPGLKEMFADMGFLGHMPAAMLALDENRWLYLVFLGVLFALFAYVACRLGGPRLIRRLHLQWLADRLAFVVPWHRKRLQRDFSAMLAVLLDSGVPEDRALTIAAQCTTNGAFARRAERAVAALEQGESLVDAVRRLDRSGEFRWRLTNAAHASVGFRGALDAWHDALDAQAFRQEQNAAQLVGTLIILFNGALVAAIAFGFWHVLTTLVEAQFLW